MTKLARTMTPAALTLLAVAAPALAHPGHSHASEAESAAHTMLIVSTGVLAAVGVVGAAMAWRRSKQG